MIDRYLLRILAGRAAISFAVIFSATTLERALRLANQLAAAGMNMRVLPSMIWNLTPHYAALAAPDAFLIGLLLTVARLDEDLEIVTMLACGFPLARMIADLVCAAVVVAAMNLALLGWFEPLGLYGFRSAQIEAVRTGWNAEAQAWAFHGRSGGVTLTADAADAGGRSLKGVFIHRRSPDGSELTLTAGAGHLGLLPDGRTATLNLGPGHALSLPQGRPPVSQTFHRLELSDPYPNSSPAPARGEQPQELTLPELLGAPTGAAAERSELYARIARVLVLPLLPFLALPLASATRGDRRTFGMATAGLIALTAREALRLAQRLGEQGRVEPLVAELAVFVALVSIVSWVFLSDRRLQGDRRLALLLPRARALMAHYNGQAHAGEHPHASVGRYLRAELGRSILLSGLGLVGVLAMIDLFERTGDILHRGFGAAGLVHYAALRAPMLAEQSIGLATLIGSVFAFLRLSRANEILALRSFGLSLVQITRMCLPVGLAVALASAALAEGAAPASQLALAKWWRTAPRPDPLPSGHWFRLGQEIVHAQAVLNDGARLSGLALYQRDPDGALRERIAAAAAVHQPTGWRLSGVSRLSIGAGPLTASSIPEMAWSGARPAELASVIARPLQISARYALRALVGAAPTDLGRGYLMTRLYRSLAEPLGPIVMLLLAMPLAPAPSRTGPSFGLLAWVLGAGLCYVISDGILTAAGQTGSAPPWFAAGLAPALFLAMAVAAMLRSDG